ncbi:MULTISPECIES: hypothetical protein [Shewanella]|uniref:DUF3649 domain-containing protein n=1 Tax=Shewanella psychromarinicola TaxID=2487742 RepID=A0A3N4E288_9GAMM|nr:hypothetical protein [Shewanella psychromarinicola]AZG34102.1 hypothetical protein EGC80_03570 [Shewanella psychromarinicola]MCL1081229.1 hypothetical protein [Shewanella psychromarinicola]RPA32193.1 hypothetical protein EGC77_10165 [Shewanella psychromarinicola]
MWPKSFSAFFWGLLLAISLMLMVFRILPVDVDVKLFVGLMLGFCMWVMVMAFCYSRNSAKAASLVCAKWLVASSLINALLFFSQT